MIDPKDPVRHEKCLGALVDEKLAADSQRKEIHLASVEFKDVPDAPPELANALKVIDVPAASAGRRLTIAMSSEQDRALGYLI